MWVEVIKNDKIDSFGRTHNKCIRYNCPRRVEMCKNWVEIDYIDTNVGYSSEYIRINDIISIKIIDE